MKSYTSQRGCKYIMVARRWQGIYILSGVVTDKVALPQVNGPHQLFMDETLIKCNGAHSRTAEQEE